MSEYQYSNDYERKETQKYEGIYTPEEIKLNKELFEECAKEHIDFAAVEELLTRGADPLGGIAQYGWDLLIHIYGDVVAESSDNNSINLPRLTELFLKYGMHVDKPRIPYDGANSLHPLWEFTFATNENSIVALKMLLDCGLSPESFAEFWDHSMIDFFHCTYGDPQYDEFLKYSYIWTFKMLLLGASYDHILENDEVLRDFICCKLNTYDIHNFRNWDDYEYYFDTVYCERHPELYGSIIHIYEKATGNEIWKIGVGKAGRETLEKLLA